MFKSYLLGLSLLAFFGVWIGCSSESSPVSPSASKALTDDDGTLPPNPTSGIPGVDFTDNNLKYEVALEIFPADLVPKKEVFGTTAFTITRADMLSLETLYAEGKGISNLTGLEYATNLDTLNLKGNNIANLAPLAGLRDLVSLNLENNLILQTGYSPLANLTKLTSLRIGGHRNADIGSDTLEVVVENMTNLTALKVNHMGLTDISLLENLKELRYLNLNGNREITNLKPLACLPNLSDLRVERVGAAYNTVTGEVNKLLLFLIGEGVYVDYIT